MVKVNIGGSIAVINDYVWTCDVDVGLEKLLNSLLPAFGPEGSDPHPDLTEAQRIMSMLGGEIMEVETADPVAGRIY